VIADRHTAAFLYRVDADTRFTLIDDAWLDFARQNDAGHLTPATVLQRPLWDFISDIETRHLYEILLEQVQMQQAPLSIPFRCDSPTCRRFMKMTITPARAGGFEFCTRIVHQERREPVRLLEVAAQRSDVFLRICSWCKRVALSPDGWVEVEEAVRALNLFGDQRLPQLTHGMCPDCKRSYLLH
jgi:hypothetical protein